MGLAALGLPRRATQTWKDAWELLIDHLTGYSMPAQTRDWPSAWTARVGRHCDVTRQTWQLIHAHTRASKNSTQKNSINSRRQLFNSKRANADFTNARKYPYGNCRSNAREQLIEFSHRQNACAHIRAVNSIMSSNFQTKCKCKLIECSANRHVICSNIQNQMQ